MTAPTFPIPNTAKISSHRLIAKMPTIAAMAYKYAVGQPFMYPDNSLSYTGNFLRMTFGVPAEEYEVIPAVERAMETGYSSSMPAPEMNRTPPQTSTVRSGWIFGRDTRLP